MFFCGLNCSLLKSHTAMVHSINANKEWNQEDTATKERSGVHGRLGCVCWGACGMVVRGRDHRRGRGVNYAPFSSDWGRVKNIKFTFLTGSLAQPTTPRFHSPETDNHRPPPLPTPLSPSSNLYKHVQNSLNNGRWENHACFFFYAFFSLFPFFKQKLSDHLRCCGALRTSPLLLTPHSIYPFKPFLFPSPYTIVCLLPPPPKFPLIF